MKRLMLVLSLIVFKVYAASPGVDSPHSANTVLAGPTSGGNAIPTFRSLVAADIGANIVNTAAIQANAVVLTTKVSGILPIANGGSAGATKQAGFDNLSPGAAKGDLIVFNGTNNVALTAGTNNFVLTADSSAGSGLKWAAAGTGAAFSGLTGGTNSSGAAMIVGSTSSLTTSGTGTITANAYNGTGNINAATAFTGLTPLANGGTAADLSATGGAHKVLFQTSGGGAITVATLVEGDLPATTAFTDTTNTFTTVQNYGNYVSLQSSTPATLTADQPAFDVGAASYSRVSAGALWAIQGIVGGINGRLAYLTNVGTSNITISHQNTNATATDRIITPTAADVTLITNSGATLIYDSTDGRWRLLNLFQVGGGGGGIVSTAISPLIISGTAIGFGTAIAPTTNDTLADAIVGASNLAKKPLVLQVKAAAATTAFEIQNSVGTPQYKFDTTVTTNEDFRETKGTAHTSTIQLQSITELLTLNTGSTTTSTSTNLLPANSFVVGVAFRVTTAITTAASFSVGDSTVSSTRFGSGVAVALNTTSTSLSATIPCEPFANDTGKPILITTNVNPGAGAVRITVYYYTLTAPGS